MVTRAASKLRPELSQFAWPTRRWSPNAISWRPSRATTGAFALPTSTTACRRSNDALNGEPVGADALIPDARVVHLDGGGHHLARRRGGEAEAGQEEGVVAAADESGIVKAFDAFAKLAAHAEPRRHQLVDAIGKRRRFPWCGGRDRRWELIGRAATACRRRRCPTAAPRARRPTPAESRRGRHTNTHVGRDPQKRNARKCSSCWRRPTQPGPETRQVPEITAIDRGGAVMPAGAFAASGPTRHGRSKARSRKSHAARGGAYPWRALNLAPGASAPRRASAEEQNCREKSISGTMSWDSRSR